MKKKTIVRTVWKRGAALSLAAVMAFSLAACGSQENKPIEQGGTSQTSQAGIDGFVYVPEFVSMSNDENTSYGNIKVHGSTLYYSEYSWNEETGEGFQKFYSREIGSDTAQELPYQFGGTQNVMQYLVDEEGNMYFFLSDYSNEKTNADGISVGEYYLHKYDSQGNEVYKQDINQPMTETNSNYIQYAALDDQGRVYASSEQSILLFDENGAYQGKVDVADWVNTMGSSKDGKVYITQYGEGSMNLVEVNFDTKALGTVYKNFPSGRGNGLTPGVEKDFLISDSACVYEYDLATQTSEVILNWLDSDINGDYVEFVTPAKDGRLLAMIRDWESNQTDLAYLTKTEASKLEEKEIITIGSLYTEQSMQAAAVKFNKTNDKYRLRIQTYIDNNSEWTETKYGDAVTALNNDIISGNGPDIFNLTSAGSVKNYVAKGVLEDLTPYLEKSSLVKKEDFLDPVLNAFTYDGVLTCIPSSFNIQTVMGRASQVGDEMGWTIDEMMEFVKSNPDASVFEYATKASILSYCLNYNQDAFINQATGECNFNSDEFKKVLEYANQFPKDYTYDEDAPSLPRKIMDGTVLLNDAYISSPEDFSVNLQMFGGDKVTCIGYPTVDGSVGCMINANNGAYGISSQSQHKEGAWAFIEFLLSDDSGNDRYSYGFPSRKDKLDALFAEAMKTEYVLDENGEKVLDDNEEPVRQSKGSWGWGNDNFTIEIFASTQEEIDQLMAVIDAAKPTSSSDSQIMQIITEEVEPYFAGQKTVDDVANVIQSRVQIYISENS